MASRETRSGGASRAACQFTAAAAAPRCWDASPHAEPSAAGAQHVSVRGMPPTRQPRGTESVGETTVYDYLNKER